MPQLNEICSYCGNNYLGCNCENFHPPILFSLSSEELVALNKLFRFLNIEHNLVLKNLKERISKWFS